MKKLALYLHWPFCVSKCPYCDFASRPAPEGLDEDSFIAATETEMDFYAAQTGEREITSFYFGGGTPSLMKPKSVARLLDKAQNLWRFAADCEVTLEANPSSSEREKFQAFREGGVNRLSLGVQSFDDEALRFLGRAHDAAQARAAIEAAREVFPRFSFDLIYARAGQSLAAWKEELAEALSFVPKHLSLYQLTIEPRTPFFKRAAKEQLQADEEEAAEMFEVTQDLLEKVGLPAYEISNHAAAGHESRHNLAYWHYDDYLGVGAGAHGRFVDVTGQRLATANESRPDRWLEKVRADGRGTESLETLALGVAQQEALMMGLRLTEGLSLQAWKEKFGSGIDTFLPAETIGLFFKEGLLEKTSTRVKATKEGRARLNAVLLKLCAE